MKRAYFSGMSSNQAKRFAVLYCRVSTVEQVSNFSLDTQQKECERFCRLQGLEPLRVFVEEGESAKTADRTRLKEMMAFCRSHRNKIALVVVYATCRFSRDLLDFLLLRKELREIGIKLQSATQLFDDSPSGEFGQVLWSPTPNTRTRSSHSGPWQG